MKILEALQAMKDGNKIISSQGEILELLPVDDDSPAQILKTLKGGSTSYIFELDLDYLFSEEEWEIYEEPEEKIINSKIECSISHPSMDHYRFMISDIPAKTEKQVCEFMNALNTFFELKCHPLIRKPSSAGWQYSMFLNKNEQKGNYFIGGTEQSSYLEKIKHGIFIFTNPQEMEKAIQDIGEQRLIHMFKTFQGIYE